MFGVPLEGPTNVFCDNQSVVKNTLAPESVLKKKNAAVSYHRVREAVASSTLRIAHEPGDTNLADILTKAMPGPKLKYLCGHIFY